MRVSAREDLERAERERLSPDAAFSDASRGRLRPEPPDPLRTCFQCDRDRILHSKSFRRLAHKTQVFLAPEGGPLPHAPHPHPRGLAGRALDCPPPRPQRGSDRGCRPGPRPGAHAIRPRRRARAQPCHRAPPRNRPRRAHVAETVRPQRAERAHRRASGARRGRPQPHPRGRRRHPVPHRIAARLHARGARRRPRRPHRLRLPRHRRRRARGAAARGGPPRRRAPRARGKLVRAHRDHGP